MTALTALAAVTGGATASKPVLSVTQGLHQGGRISLDGTQYTFGSTPDADFILNDPGVEPRHLVLRLADGKVAVEAVGGEVRVEDPQGRAIIVPLGSGYRGQLPLRIALGEAQLSLEHEQPARAAAAIAQPQHASAFTRTHVALALGLMLICAFAYAMRGEPPKPLAASVTPVPRAPQLPSLAQAHQWLGQQLLANGLEGVRLSEAGGQLVAEGRLDLTQKARWLAVRQDYDQRYGQQVMLHSMVTAQADVARPRVRFQAVWFGNNPYVISESGKRLYPGAALADGWMLERIDSDQVILARGEERFTLTL